MKMLIWEYSLVIFSVIPQAMLLDANRQDRCLKLSRMTSCFDGVLKELNHVSDKRGLLGISGEEEAIRHICLLIEHGRNCVAFRMSRCGVSLRGDEILKDYATQILKHGVVHICQTPGLLADYVRHAPCLYKHQMAAYDCLQKSLRIFSNITARGLTIERAVLDTYCQAVWRVFDCGEASLGHACGNDTANLFNEIVKLFMPEYIALECESLRKGPDMTVSTGAKKSSYFTWLTILSVLLCVPGLVPKRRPNDLLL